MKTEYVTLVAAVLAATASIAGVLFNRQGAISLEREKWQQAQEDDARKSLRALVADYARDLSAAQQRAEILAWTAAQDPASLTSKELVNYDSEARLSLSKIAAHRVLLAAYETTVYRRLEPLAVAYYRVDECIARAAASFRSDRSRSAKELAACGSL